MKIKQIGKLYEIRNNMEGTIAYCCKIEKIKESTFSMLFFFPSNTKKCKVSITLERKVDFNIYWNYTNCIIPKKIEKEFKEYISHEIIGFEKFCDDLFIQFKK